MFRDDWHELEEFTDAMTAAGEKVRACSLTSSCFRWRQRPTLIAIWHLTTSWDFVHTRRRAGNWYRLTTRIVMIAVICLVSRGWWWEEHARAVWSMCAGELSDPKTDKFGSADGSPAKYSLPFTRSARRRRDSVIGDLLQITRFFLFLRKLRSRSMTLRKSISIWIISAAQIKVLFS